MTRTRSLLVVADDFGIGPQTSRGILDLAKLGRVTGTVLLVNSPHAEEAVHAWREANCPLEVGWHPCLTLDQPLLPPGKVPSLVNGSGRFWSLGQFLVRSKVGRIDPGHIDFELRAQLQRFVALTGGTPRLVNFHHHLHVFAPVDRVLLRILSELEPRPYLRRVREDLRAILTVPGGRLKRLFLSWHGRHCGRALAQARLPNNETLAGISTPTSVLDTDYLTRWIRQVRGQVVELTCHPGHHDLTLIGRDCTAEDGRVEARVQEFNHLSSDRFLTACQEAGLSIKKLPEILADSPGSFRDAA
jgi:chitin disaccharide deacetylase